MIFLEHGITKSELYGGVVPLSEGEAAITGYIAVSGYQYFMAVNCPAWNFTTNEKMIFSKEELPMPIS